ncbi:MAG: GNAT family N-acetyltransferase [Methanolinea sp.]|nr:GNAT family N-acetyltransferase [Methanolinea sp.]
MPLPLSLHTARLVLRPFDEEDARIVKELVNHPEIAAGILNIPLPYTLQDAEVWIGQHAVARDRGEEYVFAVTEQSGNLVGATSIRVNEEHGHGELGYWIGMAAKGKGYATETVGSMLEFGFIGLGLHRIYARHLSWNIASGKVLRKSGLKYEGRMRGHAFRWGTFHDIEVYGILREEFIAGFLDRKE